jgi:lysozyme family protein
MTTADFKPFCERMISRYEGGYGWARDDSGGPTKFGITCYDLAEHRHQRMDSMSRWAPIVRAMPLSEADEIYQTKYATQCCFNELNSGCDCVVFDFGVNSGSSRAIKYAQTVVGAHVDGLLGPMTLKAINEHDSRDFINRLCDVRLGFLKNLRIWGTFGRGWSARVRDLRVYSLGLVPHAQLGAVSTPKKEGFTHKELRIPKAFAKSYGDEELRHLKETHGHDE